MSDLESLVRAVVLFHQSGNRLDTFDLKPKHREALQVVRASRRSGRVKPSRAVTGVQGRFVQQFAGTICV